MSLVRRTRAGSTTQNGNLEIDVGHLGGEQHGPIAVAVGETLLRSVMASGPDHGSGLQLDDLMQPMAHQFGDPLPCHVQSDSGANAKASESIMGTIRLVEVGLKPEGHGPGHHLQSRPRSSGIQVFAAITGTQGLVYSEGAFQGIAKAGDGRHAIGILSGDDQEQVQDQSAGGIDESIP